MEFIAILSTTAIFMTLLLLWEYKYIQRLWSLLVTKWVYPNKMQYEAENQGAVREKEDVLNKQNDLKKKSRWFNFYNFFFHFVFI